ncbi:uncharacterized protein M6B38_414210 [Iris pallida]|uniref:Uncharacterized protein n=1 Tax=Iris pallida TaxID=29817 RepID=A0AAX6FK11_IRIPA|nr:uncharacterized protein M6B38_414210 [Iris pallida]
MKQSTSAKLTTNGSSTLGPSSRSRSPRLMTSDCSMFGTSSGSRSPRLMTNGLLLSKPSSMVSRSLVNVLIASLLPLFSL